MTIPGLDIHILQYRVNHTKCHTNCIVFWYRWKVKEWIIVRIIWSLCVDAFQQIINILTNFIKGHCCILWPYPICSRIFHLPTYIRNFFYEMCFVFFIFIWLNIIPVYTLVWIICLTLYRCLTYTCKTICSCSWNRLYKITQCYLCITLISTSNLFIFTKHPGNWTIIRLE